MAKRINWVKIKTDYLTNPELSYESVANKYSIDPKTVFNRSNKEGWLVEREKTQADIQQKTLDITKVNIAEFQAKKFAAGQRLAEFGEKHIDMLERVGGMTAKELTQLGWKLSTEALGLDKAGVELNVNNYTIQQLVTDMENKEKEAIDGTATGS